MFNKIIIDSFKKSLKKELKNAYLTEDIIRYLFYYVLVNNKVIKHEEFKPEYPYSKLDCKDVLANKNRIRLDAFIDQKNKKVAIEFKYHRNSNPERNNKNDLTIQLGGLFNDINRLVCINDKCEKYLVYLTDEEMNNYLSNGRNTPKIIKEFYYGKTVNLNKCLESKDNIYHFYSSAYKAIRDETNKFKNKMCKRIIIKSLIDFNDSEVLKGHYLRVYQII